MLNFESAHSTWSIEATFSDSGSLGATLPDVPVRHALYDEAQSLESALEPQHEVPATVLVSQSGGA